MNARRKEQVEATPSPRETFLLTEVVPNGMGGFSLKPKKPVSEIDSKTVAGILGVARRSLSNIVNQPLAQQLLVWRWTSEKQGKRIFNLESVLAYRKATEDPEFGSKVLVRAER
jgi:hypothetical protein